MAEFITYSSQMRIFLIMVAITIIFLNGYFLQAALPLPEFRRRRRRLLEFSGMLLLFQSVLVFVIAHELIVSDMMVLSLYEPARYGIGMLCLAQGASDFRQNRAYLIAAAAVASLPCFDRLFPFNLILVLALILWRIYLLYPLVRRDLRSRITAYSIQEGIDTLQTGILFARPDGEIVLANAAMLDYMDSILLHQFRNAALFWRSLQYFRESRGISREMYGDTMLFRFPGGESRLFSRKIMAASGEWNGGWQITCSDVTETDQLNRELAEKNDALLERTAVLRQVLQHLEEVQQARACAEVTSRVHDLMGQRITIFQQLLKNKSFSGYASIIPLVESVMEDIRCDVQESPQEILAQLVQAYGQLGIQVHVQGVLPAEEQAAGLFVEIIREAMTNAILHGNADVIFLSFSVQDRQQRLVIRDNGRGCAKLKPGQGLRGMREKVLAAGGEIAIQAWPEFTIQADLGG